MGNMRVCVCLSVYACVTAAALAQAADLEEPRCAGPLPGPLPGPPRCVYVNGRSSDNEREFSIDGLHGKYLEVKCNGWAALDSAALPSFTSELFVPRVVLKHCPPPAASGSFANILAMLNVTLLRSTALGQGNLTLNYLPLHPPLQAAHFVGLEDLLELQLTARGANRHERRWHTPVAGFLGMLHSLRTLVVENVRLAVDELAHPPTSLRALKLKHSGMERLPKAVLMLPDLWTLELEETKFENFSVPDQLRKLSLETKTNMLQVNEIPALETLTLVKWMEQRPAALVRCDVLHTLQISSPAFEELPERWVALCPRLENLVLNNAIHLKSLPPKLLENATGLKQLSLTKCGLKTLPEELLNDLRNLRILDLSQNSIQTISSNMFVSVRALQKLDLSKNLLVGAALHPLQRLHSLTWLKLSLNPLGDLCSHPSGYSPLLQLRKLSSLSLIKTKISRICRDWRENLTFLKTLDLRKTNISVLSFSDLQYSRDESVKDDAVVLLAQTPVVSLKYSEEDYQKSQSTAASGAKVQLDEDSRLECDCQMYWARLALFPANNDRHVVPTRVTGLRCSDGRALSAVSPEEMVCRVEKVYRTDELCGREQLPGTCTCTVRPEAQAGNRTLVRVHCEGADLRQVPTLNASAGVIYDLLLANNNISSLRVADLPPRWRKLDVRNNSLKLVDNETAWALVRSPRRLLLAGNPMSCDCTAAPLLLALHSAGDNVSDLYSASCADGSALDLVPTRQCTRVPLTVWLASALAALLVTLVTAVAYFSSPERRVVITILLYRWGVLRRSHEPEDDCLFDAFVSFSHEDEDIVLQLVKGLEGGSESYRLCLHYRDWIPGRLISDQIVSSIHASRRTLAIVSHAFLDSTWARAELREAFKLALQGDMQRLIVVLLEDPAKLPFDDDLQHYLNTKTYVRWGDPWFWEKLRLALPSPRVQQTQPITSSPAATGEAAQLLLMERLLPHFQLPESLPESSTDCVPVTSTRKCPQDEAAPVRVWEGERAAPRGREPRLYPVLPDLYL